MRNLEPPDPENSCAKRGIATVAFILGIALRNMSS